MAKKKSEGAAEKIPQQEYESVESVPTPDEEIVKGNEAGEAGSGQPAVEDAEYHPEQKPSLEATTQEGAYDEKSTQEAEERAKALEEAERNDEGVWEIGKLAPETKYLDLDSGEIVTDAPHRGQGLAVKGTPITASTLTQLGKGA